MALIDQLERIQLSEIKANRRVKTVFSQKGVKSPDFDEKLTEKGTVLSPDNTNYRDTLAQNHEISRRKNMILGENLPENESKMPILDENLPEIDTDFCPNDTCNEEKHTQNPKIRAARESFLAGFAWIQEHISELKAIGWTSPALFRRSPFKYPLGPWGAAWLWPTGKNDLTVEITGTGDIRFTFSSAGRLVSQSIYRPSGSNKLLDKDRQNLSRKV